MVNIPRLVLYTNKINFAQNPRGGIESILTQLGYVPASDLITVLGQIFDTRSVFAFIDLYRVIGTDGIAITSVLFNTCLNGIPVNINIQNLRNREPRFTTGATYIETQIKSATLSSYSTFLNWLGYTYIDITQFISNPLLYPPWVTSQDSSMSSLNQSLLDGQLVTFLKQLIIDKVNLDISAYPQIWVPFQRWTNIAFNQYAFGSNINQSDWFN